MSLIKEEINYDDDDDVSGFGSRVSGFGNEPALRHNPLGRALPPLPPVPACRRPPPLRWTLCLHELETERRGGGVKVGRVGDLQVDSVFVQGLEVLLEEAVDQAVVRVPHAPACDFCITQFKAQGPSRTCNESNEEEEEAPAFGVRVSRFESRVSGFGLRVTCSSTRGGGSGHSGAQGSEEGSYLRLIDLCITHF